MNLQEIRDLVVIIAGSMIALTFVALFIFTVVIGFASKSLLSTLNRLAKEELSPLLDSARQTLQTVRGTTTFVSETTVSPIIRVYGIIAAIRRAIAVLLGIVRRRRPAKESQES